jgi:putative ABC transport system substrate-binding protein
MKMPKFTIALAVGTLAVAATTTACTPSSSDEANNDNGYKIGITQIVDHPSLNLIRDGFKDVLEEQGIEVTYDEQNAQGESSNAATIASTFAADADIDLVLAIATPTAQAVVSQETERPILFAGVTDPVDAGLVKSLTESNDNGNVSGTSDLNPEARPLELIQEIVPGATTVGFLYSSAEANSEAQLATIKEEAEPLGVTIKPVAITNSSEVATGVQALADVDAIFVPTDNTVVSAFEVVVQYANDNDIPLFSADTESVTRGAIATRGIDYYELGRRTGEMAVQILIDGEDVATIPTLVVTDTELVINSEAAKEQGVTLPPAILEIASDVSPTS